jgi:uncharacterized cupin superfamily protein
VRRVNVLAPEFDHASERDGYRWRGSRVGRTMGAEKIGGCLYELMDGQCTFPFHHHHGMEEWLIVVDGTPSVRTPEGERALGAGDVVCFPVGPAGGHQVRGPGNVLIISANRVPEAAEYPDSGKVGVMPLGKIFRIGDAVDYWEGE